MSFPPQRSTYSVGSAEFPPIQFPVLKTKWLLASPPWLSWLSQQQVKFINTKTKTYSKCSHFPCLFFLPVLSPFNECKYYYHIDDKRYISAYCVSGVSESVLITQWPHYISNPSNGLAKMHCYQNDTDYQYLYWYKQPRGKSFQLIVATVAGISQFEEGFKSGFQAEKNDKQWSLTITSIQEKDEAVYLCAARLHSTVADLRSMTKTSDSSISNRLEGVGGNHTVEKIITAIFTIKFVK